MLTNCSAQWGMGIVDCVGLYNCLLLQLIESGPLVRIVFPVLFVSVCSCWDLYTPQLMTAFHLWPSEFIFMRWFPIIGPIYYLLVAEPQFSWVRTINLVQGSSCREDEVQLWVVCTPWFPSLLVVAWWPGAVTRDHGDRSPVWALHTETLAGH